MHCPFKPPNDGNKVDAGKIQRTCCMKDELMLLLLTILAMITTHNYRKLIRPGKEFRPGGIHYYFFFAGHIPQILAKDNQ